MSNENDSSSETIRTMLQGFTSMQQHLGLMPMSGGQQPMGVPLNMPPPPPPVMHPGEVAQQAAQYHQAMSQQNMQMAQATRYAPPPSAPAPSGGFSSTWGPSLQAAQAGQANPYLAQAMGGMPGMPNPGMMTSPQFGLYRGQPGASPYPPSPMYSAHVPSYMTPFAPQMPGAHFMTPAMQNYQMMQARQAQSVGTVGALTGFGASAIGGIGGAALGSLLGPVGGFLGGMAGSAIGGAFGDMMTMPGMADIRHGRQLQNVMAPWMVSGGNLNPYTGQGMDRQSGQATAHQLRTMVRDRDFQHLGFNTQDVMRITQLSADQGLLQTAQNPEQITRQIKDISKAVKALVQITGDPDVKSAIASLGQMRTMGFEGLSAQMGAVANRAHFSRMAGVSQQQMQQYEAAGAMQATQMGLAGSTGITAAQMGAGAANIAAGTGAVGGLALARAGGQQGFAQTLARAQMASIAFDPYLMASVQRGKNGEMELDMESYQGLKGRSLSDVVRQGGERLGQFGGAGLGEFARRRKEMGERLSQKMSKTDLFLLPLQQAQAIQQDVGNENMDLGSAFTALGTRAGMSDGETQALSKMYTDPRVYKAHIQQLQMQKRQAADQESARRALSRTPGMLRRLGHQFNGQLNSLSDELSSPFTAFAERGQRIDEDRAAEDRSASVRRYGRSELIQTSADRALALEGMRSSDGRRMMRSTHDPMANEWESVTGEISHALGLSARSPAQRMIRAASESGGQGLLFFNNPFVTSDAATRRMQDVEGAAEMIRAGATRTDASAIAQKNAVTQQARGVIKDPLLASKFNMNTTIAAAADLLRSKIHTAKNSDSAGAMTASDVKDVVVTTLTSKGMSKEAAEEAYAKRPEFWGGEITRHFTQSGDRKAVEVLAQTLTSGDSVAGIDQRKERKNVDVQMERNLEELGLKTPFGMSNVGPPVKDLDGLKRLIKTTDPKILALAAAMRAGTAGAKERDRILGSMSNEEGTAAQTKAGELISAQSEDTLNALGRIGSQAHGNIEQRLREARHTIGVKMGANAFTSAAQSIATNMGDSSLSGAEDEESLLGSLAKRSAEDLNKIKNPKLRAAALAFKKAGTAQERGAAVASFQEGAVGTGPGATAELTGGTRGDDVDRIDTGIESLRRAQGEMADSPEGKTQEVLADAAVVLGDAAKHMERSMERLDNVLNSPKFTSVQ